MLRRLIPARAGSGFAENEVVLLRCPWQGGGWAISDDSELDRIQQLPDDFVLLELSKFDSILTAYSMGEIRRELAERNRRTAKLEPGFAWLMPKKPSEAVFPNEVLEKWHENKQSPFHFGCVFR